MRPNVILPTPPTTTSTAAATTEATAAAASSSSVSAAVAAAASAHHHQQQQQNRIHHQDPPQVGGGGGGGRNNVHSRTNTAAAAAAAAAHGATTTIDNVARGGATSSGENHHHHYNRDPTPSTAAANAATTAPTNTSLQLQRVAQARQSPLFCMVWNRSWEEIVRRSRRSRSPNKRRPHEQLELQDDSTGNTLLHEACRLDPPPDIIRALSATCRVPNHQGATPLHIAASHRISAEALKVLLECAASTPRHNGSTTGTHTRTHRTHHAHHAHNSHSPTADLSNMGRAPIHYACMSFRGLEIDAFLLLLDETLKQGNLTLSSEQHFGLEDMEGGGFGFGGGGGVDFGVDGQQQQEPELEFSDDEELYQDFMSLKQSAHNNKGSSNHNNNMNQTNNSFVDDDLSSTVSGGGITFTTLDDGSKVVNVMSLKDALGMTPLALLFRRYRQRVRSVISTVDKLNLESPSQAALASAITVRAELGELWEKARRIVSRLTQERLHHEQKQQQHQTPSLHEQQEQYALRSPGEVAAASWAAEQQSQQPVSISERDFLPVMYVEAAVNGRNNHREGANGNTTSNSSNNNNNSRASPPQEVPPTPASTSAAATTAASAAVGPSASAPDVSSATPTAAVASNPPASAAECVRPFRIVHASVGLIGYGCPPEMIRLAISIHPHQVHEMDEDGNLPLHLAVQASSYLASTSSGVTAASASVQNDDLSVLSSDALSFFSTATISQTNNPFDKVIKILLQHYPRAAQIPHGKTGELPLVTAIRSQNRTWDDGIRTLLNAYPPALFKNRLISSGLYPHVLALVTSKYKPVREDGGTNDVFNKSKPPRPTTWVSRSKQRRQEACARSALFELLRAKPEFWLSSQDNNKRKKKAHNNAITGLDTRSMFLNAALRFGLNRNSPARGKHLPNNYET